MTMQLPQVARAAEVADPLVALGNAVIAQATPMSKFDQLFQDVLGREGKSFTWFKPGGKNKLKDPPTKFGVTIDSLSDYLGRDATVDEVRHMTQDTAKAVYHQNYYKRFGIDKLPEHQQDLLMDMFTNHSPDGVAVIMQDVLKQNGKKVKFDGAYGPETRKAYEQLSNSNPDVINDQTVDARRRYYESLAERPDKEGFYWGWIDRAESFRREPLPEGHVWNSTGSDTRNAVPKRNPR